MTAPPAPEKFPANAAPPSLLSSQNHLLSGGNRRVFSAGVLLALLLIHTAGYLYLARRGLTNLENDGRGHLSIARRLCDSKTPGYYQLGTVWLPLPHVLAGPLARSDRLWRSGAAGSLISLAAGTATGFFLWRLLLLVTGAPYLALGGAALFVLNPNWLYFASTPMTEPLLLCLLLAAVLCVVRFAEEGKWSELIAAAVSTALASLTRYDGWFMIPMATLGVGAVARGTIRRKAERALVFLAVASLAPLYWLIHNAVLFGDALAFARGPYSAKALYARQIAETGFHFPTDHHLMRSVYYYLEAARLDCGTLLLAAALAGACCLAWRRGRLATLAAALLLTPLLAYPSSLYGGNIAIYVPRLYPFTHFNIRYGLAMLPAAALLATLALAAIPSHRLRWLLLALLLAQNVWLARHGLDHVILAEEARIHMAGELKIAEFAGGFLGRHYDFGNVLVYAGGNTMSIEGAGLRFRQTIYEGNLWQWDAARRFPLGAVRWVLTRRGDPLWDWAHRDRAATESFELVAQWPGEVEIYRQRVDAPARRVAAESAFIIAAGEVK